MYRLLAVLSLLGLLNACTTPPKPRPRPRPAPPPVSRAPVAPQDPLIAELGRDAPPEREQVREPYRFDRAISMGRLAGVRLYTYSPAGRERVVGFSLIDGRSPRINPLGAKGNGAKREFLFQFPDRAREEIALMVSDDVHLSKRYSRDNMFREVHLFPRRQLPSLRRKGDRFEVRLPTGEPVLFDAQTAEIVGGVLQEQPIDFNRNRFARHNPRIRYTGQGLLITVAQRGEAPRRARVWGQKKRAEVRYPSHYRKPCYLSPALLWDQRPKKGDRDPRLTWRLKRDAEVFDLVEKRCHWDLSALRGG